MECLVCQCDSVVFALGLQHVAEVMRPLRLEEMPDAGIHVLGASVIRGSRVAVLNAGRLLGLESSVPGRVVTLKVGETQVGLACDAVIGVRSIPSETLRDAPRLVDGAARSLVADIELRDAALAAVLNGIRVIPGTMAAT